MIGGTFVSELQNLPLTVKQVRADRITTSDIEERAEVEEVTVVEEATFDRADVSHRVSLFDMHQKYADVAPEEEVVAYFRELVAELDD